MSDSLKSHVARRGGLRLAVHARLRDRLVDMAIEEFPVTAAPINVEDVLRARMAVRLRREYGSVVAMFLISVLVNAIVRIVIEWWFQRPSHRILMEGWHRHAVARPDISPA